MGKVTSSANKEKSTNSYAADNQAAIKKLASSASKVARSIATGGASTLASIAIKKVTQHLDIKKAQ